MVHYGYIEKFIEQLGERFNIREIAFDRWGAVQMVQNLEGMGFTVVPFGQGFKDMSPPTKELMKLVLEERIAHGGHPVLRWMMDNIYIRTDPAGNIKADKEKSTEKIDGAIATIMGLDRAIRCGNDTGASVYDRGILSAEDRQQVHRALELVGAAHLADRDFNRISDGQRQRILLEMCIRDRGCSAGRIPGLVCAPRIHRTDHHQPCAGS